LGRLQVGQHFAFAVHGIVESVAIVVGVLRGTAGAAAAGRRTRGADQVGQLVLGLLGARLGGLGRLVGGGRLGRDRLGGRLLGGRLGSGLGDLHRSLGRGLF